MTRKAKSALDLPAKVGHGYPKHLAPHCEGRERRRLGDAFGLNDFGVNLLRLPPGDWSALRHWHRHEDEFVYVLAGTPSLVTDAGQERLSPGDVVGFKAGEEDGHHIVNDTPTEALLLEVGARKPDIEEVFYPGLDLKVGPDDIFRRLDGTAYEED